MSPEKEEMKKKRNHIEKTQELTAQSALLDFYSDRAVAHASFLVASVFGIVTLLAIVQQMINVDMKILLYLSLLPFLAFSYLGFWALQRFGKFAAIADKLQADFLKHVDFDLEGEKEKFSGYLSRTMNRSQKQLIVKRILEKLGKRDPIMLYLAYLLIVIILSLIVYLQISDAYLYIFYGFAVLVLVIAVIIYPLSIKK